MTIIFNTNQYDTPETVALATQINHNDRLRAEQEKVFRNRENDLCEQYTELLLAQRPTYPVAEHLQAIDQIVDMLKAGTAYGTHLGRPTSADVAAGNQLPHNTSFASEYLRINFHADAPYRPRTGRKLWSFTETEQAAFIAELTKRGINVIDSWNHDDGLGICMGPTLP